MSISQTLISYHLPNCQIFMKFRMFLYNNLLSRHVFVKIGIQ
jgi:hypothetical protein